MGRKKTKKSEEIVEETPVEAQQPKSRDEDEEIVHEKRPRYTIGLQKHKDDPSCYKDVIDLDSEKQAIEEAEGYSVENNLKTIVFDRELGMIIYKYPVPEPEKKKGKK